MTAPRILAICGSLRLGSFNRKLLALGVAQARALGAEVDVVDLKAQQLPVYDGDLEDAGLPPSVVDLRERASRAQGLLIASPEYNSSIPGGLKNAIDWISRPPGRIFRGKWAALTGASPGGFGTVRMQPHLRQVFSTLGVMVLPDQVLISRAEEAFTPEGNLKEEAKRKELDALVATLVAHLKASAL